MDPDGHQADNLANWNDRVGIHAASADYGLKRYAENPDHLCDVIRFDAPLLGDVSGCSLVHLQCHIGTDTISLARLGAQVTGLDFSAPALAVARELSSSSDTPAIFVEGNVYDAPEILERTYDVVYTSVGAVNWIGDLDRWAASVAGLLTSGGRFYIRDTHPSLWVYEEVDGDVRPYYDYFTTEGKPLTTNHGDTYTDGDAAGIRSTTIHEWNHSIPDMVNALVGNGMIIDRMLEHEGIDWPFVQSAVKEGTQWYFPKELRGKVPAMYSLWASKL